MKAATAVLAGTVLAASGLGYAQDVSQDTIRAISAGRHQYVQHCAACHGMLARGNTNVAFGTDGQTCTPPDLTALSQRQGRFEDVRVLHHVLWGDAKTGMPALRGTHGRSPSDPRTQLDAFNLLKYIEWVQLHEGVAAH